MSRLEKCPQPRTLRRWQDNPPRLLVRHIAKGIASEPLFSPDVVNSFDCIERREWEYGNTLMEALLLIVDYRDSVCTYCYVHHTVMQRQDVGVG
ncbi:hypothetical protein M758_UG297100 [Ceratodon purpureus]|nr:hypothetical protein M758_UG297100 [Ceratodon purpureus]